MAGLKRKGQWCRVPGKLQLLSLEGELALAKGMRIQLRELDTSLS